MGVSQVVRKKRSPEAIGEPRTVALVPAPIAHVPAPLTSMISTSRPCTVRGHDNSVPTETLA